MALTPRQIELIGLIKRLKALPYDTQVQIVERAKEIKRERRAKELADAAIKKAATRR